MKKISIIFLTVFALVCVIAALSACTPQTALGNLQADFTDGKLHLTWDGNADSFDIYAGGSVDGEFVKVDSVKKNEFVADDYRLYYVVSAVKGGKEVWKSQPYCYLAMFGDNVRVFTPDTDDSAIQSEITRKYARTIWDEFSEMRQAYLFMPGQYAVTAQVGYYTTVAGLGYSPADVTLDGFRTEENPIASGSLINFWRGAENFSVNSDALWCVSQATFLRRMNFRNNLALDGGGYSSGGFLADSKVGGNVTNNTQQQWFSRNSNWNNWTKSDINMVFSGVVGDVKNTWPNPRNTVLENTTVMKEKPFLVFDEQQGFGVFAPSLTRDTKGVSWDGASGAEGKFVPISTFYIASPEVDNAATINAAIEDGKHVLFTPGIYNIEAPITVNYGNTILLGMGLATLRTTADNNDGAVVVGDVPGVTVCGLLVDAGSYCKTLMTVGNTKHANVGMQDNPIHLADMFFRLGGDRYRDKDGQLQQRNVGADVTLLVNADNVLGDNFWMWRADHGMDGSVLLPYTDQEGGLLPDAAANSGWKFWRNFSVGWKGAEYGNYGKNGIVVNGDDVTIYGLMVEHYGEYQTIWNGERGFMCFYQSETPYDAPNQSAWMCGDKKGYASYKVADHVQTHNAYGIGVYYVCNGKGIQLDSAIEAPSAKGINLFHMAVANFKTNDGNGINHIVNDRGTGVFSSGAKTSFTSYIGGVYTN